VTVGIGLGSINPDVRPSSDPTHPLLMIPHPSVVPPAIISTAFSWESETVQLWENIPFDPPSLPPPAGIHPLACFPPIPFVIIIQPNPQLTAFTYTNWWTVYPDFGRFRAPDLVQYCLQAGTLSVPPLVRRPLIFPLIISYTHALVTV
jgi:hypothetical protein